MSEAGSEPLVCSIICTTYNHSRFCRVALESVYAQDYPHIEIVVIDDGSTDGNIGELEKVLARSPYPHKLIAQENTGNVPLNVNRAIAAATGDYISLFSLDDLLLPGAISSKMEIVRQDPSMVLVANTCNKEIDDDGETVTEHFESPLYRKSVESARELLEIEYEQLGTFYNQAAVLQTAMVRAVGGMDPDISGDDIILRTKMFKYMVARPELKFTLLHEPGMAYRKHGTNIHLNTWNQIKTVIDWHGRYFPDSPLPDLAHRWISHFVYQALKSGDKQALAKAERYSPVLEAALQDHRKSWKFRRRRAKAAVRRMLGIRA
ncbi:glycosyltransferase family A protein [Cribrihabitans pelagius]|uniref:glycosyltransferase family A protein n=1 Tax=Cribrihabitans pelagius TaxID=1765746 RepID=UPI003B5A274E